ncbi:MAG: phosphatase PAP2 family protein [Pseudomonadota bacterium]
MKFRHLLLPLLLTLTACAGGDKYPYPRQFVGVEDVGVRVLGTPPAPHTKIYDAEIDGILARQAALTDAQKATILAEDHIHPGMLIEPVLGAGYDKDTHPALFTLLAHAASDAWRTGDAMQDYWKRDRPWVADHRVQLYTKPITRPSYPSGHTTTNTVWAYVLGDLFPKKRDALLARASEIGFHRVDGGVHFPHDVAGGKRLAYLLYTKMRSNPDYQRELKAARLELELASPTGEMPLPRGTVCAMPHQAGCH